MPETHVPIFRSGLFYPDATLSLRMHNFKAMIILLTESKTMSDACVDIASDEYVGHKPLMEADAEAIVDRMREWPLEEIASRIGISLKLARYERQCAYDFPNKASGVAAAEAFTGVVFKAMDYPSLSAEAKWLADRKLVIMSSLYGFLRCFDVVKPYRLGFEAKLGNPFEPLWKYWKLKCTVALVNMLKMEGEREVLNLMPADASKCFDWKVVKSYARVTMPLFRELVGGGNMRTPSAGRLKEARGRMARGILERSISTSEQLRIADSDACCYYGESEYGDRPVFLV